MYKPEGEVYPTHICKFYCLSIMPVADISLRESTLRRTPPETYHV